MAIALVFSAADQGSGLVSPQQQAARIAGDDVGKRHGIGVGVGRHDLRGHERRGGARALAACLALLVMGDAPLLVAEPALLLDDVEQPAYGRQRRRLAGRRISHRRQPQHQLPRPVTSTRYRHN